MKKRLSFIISGLALLSLNVSKTLPVVAESLETTLKEDCAYKVDFENFAIGANEDELYQQTALFWFDTAKVDAEVVEYDASKALQYTFLTSGSMGGLGQGDMGNLAKLINGATYEFSAKVDLLDVAENAELYFEYQKSTWTGVKLTRSGVSNLNSSSTFDVSYENKILKFSFVAAPWADNASLASWIKITGLNFNNGNKVIVDDVKFVKKSIGRTYVIDFENETIGDAATPSSTAIDYVWNGDASSVTIQGDEQNKFLRVSGTSSGTDIWAKFYINTLWNMVSDENYRLEFDVLQNNSAEWYICYHESGGATATYSSSALLGVSNNRYNSIIHTTFDGSHVVFDFTPSTNVNANFWPQIAIVVKYHQDMVFDMDNVMITHFDNIHTELMVEVENTTQYVNQEIDMAAYGVSLQTKSGRVREVAFDEMIVDTSLVNNKVAGIYPITIRVVDELKKEFSKTVTITYIEDTLSRLEVLKNPDKLVYEYNEEMDLSGLIMNRIYESGKVDAVDISTLSIIGYDKTMLGDQSVTLRDESGYSITLHVTVIDVLDSIVITQTPIKMEYDVGQALDLTGLEVEAIMRSGARKTVVVTRDMVSGFDSTTEGKNTITITCGDKTATFELTIVKSSQQNSDSSSNVVSDEPSNAPSDEPSNQPSISEDINTGSNNTKKGCNGSAASSSLFISLIGILFLTKKQKK